jgi:hypothetical protein
MVGFPNGNLKTLAGMQSRPPAENPAPPSTGGINGRSVFNNMHQVSTKTPLKPWQETALIVLSIGLLGIPMAIGRAFSSDYRAMWNRVFADKKVEPKAAMVTHTNQGEQDTWQPSKVHFADNIAETLDTTFFYKQPQTPAGQQILPTSNAGITREDSISNRTPVASARPSLEEQTLLSVNQVVLKISQQSGSWNNLSEQEIHQKVIIMLSQNHLTLDQIMDDQASKEIFIKNGVLIKALFDTFPETKCEFIAQYLLLNESDLLNTSDSKEFIPRIIDICKSFGTTIEAVVKNEATSKYFNSSEKLSLTKKVVQSAIKFLQDKQLEADIIALAEKDAKQGEGGLLSQIGLNRQKTQLPVTDLTRLIKRQHLILHSDKPGGSDEKFKLGQQALELIKAGKLAEYYDIFEQLEEQNPKKTAVVSEDTTGSTLELNDSVMAPPEEPSEVD